MKHPFDRGILFPPEVENKRLTAGLPPEEFRPKTLVIPLKQGIGEACVPVVEPGQGVKAGELVGRPLKEGVPVHCGVSGTVSAVENRPTLEGEGLCVVVENDFAGRRRLRPEAGGGTGRTDPPDAGGRAGGNGRRGFSHLSEIRLGQAAGTGADQRL